MNRYIRHPVRCRFNRWIVHATVSPCHKVYGEWKQQIFKDLPDSVTELGPGTGANFRYYRRGTRVTAIEPNPLMHDHLRRSAEQYGIDLDIREARAEKELDLADESKDAIVATLVLCSVNQTQVLNHIYRILKPEGRFLFLEHIAAPKGTLLRRFQDLIGRFWQWGFEGCKLNCDTDSALRTAGFSKLELEHFALKGLLSVPAKHHIVGIATK